MWGFLIEEDIFIYKSEKVYLILCNALAKAYEPRAANRIHCLGMVSVVLHGSAYYWTKFANPANHLLPFSRGGANVVGFIDDLFGKTALCASHVIGRLREH